MASVMMSYFSAAVQRVKAGFGTTKQLAVDPEAAIVRAVPDEPAAEEPTTNEAVQEANRLSTITFGSISSIVNDDRRHHVADECATTERCARCRNHKTTMDLRFWVTLGVFTLILIAGVVAILVFASGKDEQPQPSMPSSSAPPLMPMPKPKPSNVHPSYQ